MVSNKSLRILRSCIALTMWHIGPCLGPIKHHRHGCLVLRHYGLHHEDWHNGLVVLVSWLRANCPCPCICNVKRDCQYGHDLFILCLVTGTHCGKNSILLICSKNSVGTYIAIRGHPSY